MKVLVTGSNGFIGKNLVAELRQHSQYEILEMNRQTSEEEIDQMIQQAEFIFHLAGVNRPIYDSEFMTGNHDLTVQLLEKLKENKKSTPILVTSTIQASLDNPYGKSKLACEKVVKEYGEVNKVKTYIYRLPNVFGKLSKPHYNSVVATFCYNIARGTKIEVHDRETLLNLVYIDDVIKELLLCLDGKFLRNEEHGRIPQSYQIKLGDLADLLIGFKNNRNNLLIPDMSNSLVKYLYSTYLSYLPKNDFGYPLVMHQDNRGSFTEFIKSPQGGQVSINRSKPGITKGNHWHHTKNEKFIVVFGEGLIRFRGFNQHEIIEYPVSAEKLEVIDIPVGYTHSIVNTGETDMVTVMWVNELFNPDMPDTYYLEVE